MGVPARASSSVTVPEAAKRRIREFEGAELVVLAFYDLCRHGPALAQALDLGANVRDARDDDLGNSAAFHEQPQRISERLHQAPDFR